MADLVLDWSLLGAYGTALEDTGTGGAPVTIDTGGIGVQVAFEAQDANAEAFTFSNAGFVGAGETFDPNSWLKLFGEGGDGGGVSSTSTTTLTFGTLDDTLYTDAVQDVSFRLSDIDADAAGEDLAGPDGALLSFEDNVTVLAFDLEGNAIPVTITSSGAASTTGSTATGEVETDFTDADGSLLVEIAGPVGRIEIVYENGGNATQGALISDVEFSTVDVEPNLDPIAEDDSGVTEIDTAITIDVLDNDSDPEGGDLTITFTTDPANGSIVENGDGTITYTPDAGFVGTDTFEYDVSDPSGNSDTAIVTVEVRDPNGAPIAGDDTITGDADTDIIVPVLDNDSDPDGDPLTVTGTSTPTNGSVVINGDGTITYTPDAGFSGTDTFTYDVTDGTATDTATVTVEVGEPNLPPVAEDDTASTTVGDPVTIAVLDNDSDPEGGALTITFNTDPANGSVVVNGDGTITYTPDAGFTGTDTFEYDISDPSGDSDTGVVTVTVGEPSAPRIDTDVFPVDPADQALDPLDGLDEDPDPSDDLDSVVGTAGADTISTGDDADTIEAGDGDDSIAPGIDNDLVYLEGGDDTLFDAQGADTIYGGDGNDSIIAGTDTFSDYVGDDPAFDPGTPLNGLGFDRDPNREDGRDWVEGNLGDDYIETGDDRDTLDGGEGNDTLDGGIDDDSIIGGAGDDSLIGAHGSDTLLGGDGNDTLDGSNSATLTLRDDVDPTPENDRDLIEGGAGDDVLTGGDDDDTLYGDSGEDRLFGGIDEDELYGGADSDTLIGGDGNDTLNGNDGTDYIDGGADRDVIVVDSASDGTGDFVHGGNEGDDWDRLDLTGVGVEGVDWRLTNVVADDDGARPSNGIDGTVEFLDGSGGVTGTMEFTNIEEIVPCFTPGTVIATPQGERLVEDLKPGDKVITRDNGIQEIRWVGRKDLTGHELARAPHLRPVLIQKGALGNNLPEHDLLVSPNHRVLVSNDKTALYFEESEVLAAAKHLTALEGVDEVEAMGVGYIHIMFERHEVVLSNGAWTESFQPGDYTLKGIGSAQRAEILELFPELAEAEGLEAYQAARRSLKKHEAALLTK